MLNFSLPQMISLAVVLLVALPIHELAHALAADYFGDDTPRLHGRITLNPFAHLDLVGSLMLLLAGFGWAKPVPVNEYALSMRSRYAPALVRFVVVQKGAETGLASRPLSGGALIDEMTNGNGVAMAVEQQTIRRETVSSGPADFLVIGFGIFGKVMMEDETEVELSPEQSLYVAQALARADHRHQALEAYYKVMQSKASPSFRLKAAFELAELHLAVNELSRARDVLQSVLPLTASHPEWRKTLKAKLLRAGDH